MDDFQAFKNALETLHDLCEGVRVGCSKCPYKTPCSAIKSYMPYEWRTEEFEQ